MTMILALLAIAIWSESGGAPVLPAAPVAAAVSPTPASEAAAVDGARQFLTLLDRDDWPATWQRAFESFQLLNTVE